MFASLLRLIDRHARTDRTTPRVVGRVRLQPAVYSLQARYDAAPTTHENRRHWANADHLSANAAANVDVRRILRSRARYEVANSSYAKGIVATLANYVVGAGPRLQMLTNDPESQPCRGEGVRPLGEGGRPGAQAPHDERRAVRIR